MRFTGLALAVSAVALSACGTSERSAARPADSSPGVPEPPPIPEGPRTAPMPPKSATPPKVAASPAQPAQPAPSTSPPPVVDPRPEPSYDAALTAAERARNVKAYREIYLDLKGALAQSDSGRWLAIAGGRIIPSIAEDTVPQPVETMAEADAAARAEVPGARHRFVFRIAEDGRTEQNVGGCELPHVLGGGFFTALERDDVEMRAVGPGQPVFFVKDGARTEITVKGPDRRMFLQPEVGPPLGPGRADALFVLSSGFGRGNAVLSAETAAAASLHLWEIPGRVEMGGVYRSGECRRARARFRFPGTDLDFTMTVAIWPE